MSKSARRMPGSRSTKGLLKRICDGADSTSEGLHGFDEFLVGLCGLGLADGVLQGACQSLDGLAIQDGPGSAPDESHDLAHVVDDLLAIIRGTVEAVSEVFEILLDVECGAHRMVICHGKVG